MINEQNLLKVENLKVYYQLSSSGFKHNSRLLYAVNNISFTIKKGETLGIVGESGCGKSTIAKTLSGLIKANDGKIIWKDIAFNNFNKNTWNDFRKNVQMIFQDPISSLNPRMTIGQSIAEPLHNFYPNLTSKDIQKKIIGIINKVGLQSDSINRYPHEFSGGQCQRAVIARALISDPELIICDEPVSSLDVSIQAQIINLLQSLKDEMGLSLLFISHDLNIVQHISDRIMVMYLGKKMEMLLAEKLYKQAKHPYTKVLLNSMLLPDPEKKIDLEKIIFTEESTTSPLKLPSGCVFKNNCPLFSNKCHTQPTLQSNNSHELICHHVTLN